MNHSIVTDSATLDAALADPFRLDGRRVLVAGAGGGIGAATAQVCAQMGAEVVLADIVEEAQVRHRVGLPDVSAYRLDFADRVAVSALAEAVGDVFAVIDASGISPLDDWMADDWDEAFDRVIGTNVRGPINLARAFMPGMMARGGGRIVLCGSVSGRMGGVKCGPHYAAAKGGLHNLTRWLAQKGVRSNVLVNAVAPASVATPMAAAMGFDASGYPQGRAGRPLELGATLAFLCTPAAGFIAGAVIDANGGSFMA